MTDLAPAVENKFIDLVTDPTRLEDIELTAQILGVEIIISPEPNVVLTAAREAGKLADDLPRKENRNRSRVLADEAIELGGAAVTATLPAGLTPELFNMAVEGISRRHEVDA